MVSHSARTGTISVACVGRIGHYTTNPTEYKSNISSIPSKPSRIVEKKGYSTGEIRVIVVTINAGLRPQCAHTQTVWLESINPIRLLGNWSLTRHEPLGPTRQDSFNYRFPWHFKKWPPNSVQFKLNGPNKFDALRSQVCKHKLCQVNLASQNRCSFTVLAKGKHLKLLSKTKLKLKGKLLYPGRDWLDREVNLFFASLSLGSRKPGKMQLSSSLGPSEHESTY